VYDTVERHAESTGQTPGDAALNIATSGVKTLREYGSNYKEYSREKATSEATKWVDKEKRKMRNGKNRH
jgi:hypothetical protein